MRVRLEISSLLSMISDVAVPSIAVMCYHQCRSSAVTFHQRHQASTATLQSSDIWYAHTSGYEFVFF